MARLLQSAQQIEKAPSFAKGDQTDYILGIGKFGNQVTLLLDLQYLIEKNDLDEAKQTIAA